MLLYLGLEIQESVEGLVSLSVVFDDGLILLDEPGCSFDGECDLVGGHVFLSTEQHLAKGTDVVLDGLEGMVGVSGDLFDGVLVDEELVNDDALVGERGSHVMDGAASRQDLASFQFPLCYVFPDRAWGQFEEQGDLGVGQDAVLLIGLGEQPGGGVAFEVAELASVSALRGFVMGHEVKDDGNELGLGDGLSVRGSGVLVDGDPGGLSGAEMMGFGIEGLNHIEDGVDQDAPGAFSAELGTFLLEEGDESAVEAFVLLRPELALVGIEALVHFDLHAALEFVAQVNRFFSSWAR